MSNEEYIGLDKNVISAVLSIQNKGHVRYIRYLLSKRVPPTSIKKELGRLSLSAPDRDTLSVYFEHIMLPMIRECGLTEYYTNYYERLATGKAEKELTPTLSFDVTFEDKEADRVAFCRFVRNLEIEDMWSREIVRYYGGIHHIPQNEQGERVIKVVKPRNVENILTNPKKYIIDKLLLENVPAARIEAYLWEKHQLKINDADISAYAKYFFNFERRDIETLIEQLITERNSVESDLDILYNNDELTLGDKAATASQYEKKIKFLDETISELNAKYSELSYQQGLEEKINLENIIEDMIRRGYDRFKMLDKSKDRDVVKPITDISKMVFTAIDKKQQLENHKIKVERTVLDRDKNAGEIMLELYQEAYDRAIKSMETKHIEEGEPGVPLDEIEGLDEV